MSLRSIILAQKQLLDSVKSLNLARSLKPNICQSGRILCPELHLNHESIKCPEDGNVCDKRESLNPILMICSEVNLQHSTQHNCSGLNFKKKLQILYNMVCVCANRLYYCAHRTNLRLMNGEVITLTFPSRGKGPSAIGIFLLRLNNP